MTPMHGRVRGLPGDGLLHDGLGDVDGDREADALRPSGDGGVDADHVAVASTSGAAGVAGIDRGVGLDEVAQRAPLAGDRIGRPRRRVPGREMTPAVTLLVRVPSGLPMAMAIWPGLSADESPMLAAGRAARPRRS